MGFVVWKRIRADFVSFGTTWKSFEPSMPLLLLKGAATTLLSELVGRTQRRERSKLGGGTMRFVSFA